MFKVFIFCLLIASSGGIGILKARGLSERKKILNEYLSFLQLLITELNYSNISGISIPEILLKMSENEKEKVSCLCREVVQEIRNEKKLDYAFDKAFDSIYGKSLLNNTDKEVMKLTGKYLESFAIKGQTELLVIQKEKILNRLADAIEQEKIKGKMYKSLGFYIGTCLAILLI